MKKIKSIFKTSIFSLLAFGAAFCADAEAFRVHKTHMLYVEPVSKNTAADDSTEASTSVYPSIVSAGINDAVCILLPKDLTFIQGIEVTVKIPQAITRCPNTVIYSIYDNVSPLPSGKTIDYTGKELYTSPYPGQVAQTILIPLVRGNTIKQSPYADKTFIPEYSRGFIFLRNQLAMKGVPQDALNGKFIITAKPILINKGQLKIIAGTEKPEDLIVLIDGTAVTLNKEGSCILKPGTHNVTISTEGSRNENRTCVIETAQTTILEIDLKSIAPSVIINMPSGTHLTIDNQSVELKGSAVSLKPGEHILKFSLGGYESVKKVTIQEGRSYTINVSLDVDFSEN